MGFKTPTLAAQEEVDAKAGDAGQLGQSEHGGAPPLRCLPLRHQCIPGVLCAHVWRADGRVGARLARANSCPTLSVVSAYRGFRLRHGKCDREGARHGQL